jgi:dGTP triphosphohydrolase
MFDQVYFGPHARLEHERAQVTIRRIFDYLVERGDEPEQIVDFISGMTDRYALAFVSELG